MAVRTWGFLLVALVASAATACVGSDGSSSGAGDGTDIEPATLVGTTEQGLRLRIDLVGDRDVSLRFPVECHAADSPDSNRSVALHRHRFETSVDDDGGFTVDEEYVEDGTDGDEDHVEVRIEGDFAADGTASGSLDVTSRWWNGQGHDFGPDCVTGTVAWTADRPPVEGDNLVVPVAASTRVAPAGDDLLARSEANDLLLVDAATGDARRLDGAAPAGPTTQPAEPGVPSTLVAGPSAVSAAAPIWLQPLEVVADGVWTIDPSTGLVTRFELADGARSATIDVPLDRIAAGPDALWTVSTNAFRSGFALDKRDPVTGAVVASTPVERGAIVAGPTDVWYADATLAGGRVAPIDPATLALGERVPVDIPLHDDDLVHTGDRVWWLGTEGLMAVDLMTGHVGPFDLRTTPDEVAGDPSGVWTVHEREAVARRIEGGQVVRTVDIPDGWWSVVVTADGAVWLCGDGGPDDEWSIVRLDPAVTG